MVELSVLFLRSLTNMFLNLAAMAFSIGGTESGSGHGGAKLEYNIARDRDDVCDYQCHSVLKLLSVVFHQRWSKRCVTVLKPAPSSCICFQGVEFVREILFFLHNGF